MTEKRPARASATHGRRVAVTVAASLLAFGIVVGVALALSTRVQRAPDFTLTDQNGRPFHLSDLRRHTVALFFGYTHCPDECPTTLAALARTKRSTTVDFIGPRGRLRGFGDTSDTPDQIAANVRQAQS